MTKKLLFGAALFGSVFMCSPNAEAHNTEVCNGMANKLNCGVVNILSGWMEIPCDIYYGYDEGLDRYGAEKPAVSRSRGMLRGLFRGTYQGVGRTVEGAIDVLGFWAADPLDNKTYGYNFDSRYGWERGQVPDYTDPPCDIRASRKMDRGVHNLLFGIAEVPSQIRTGVIEPAPIAGFGRAIWFGLSRPYEGLADLVTLFLPTWDDTYGYSFERDPDKQWGTP
jgi:hypothetical protein